MTLNILGTEYTVTKRKYGEDPAFVNLEGYCDRNTKEIVYCDMTTYPGWGNSPKKACEEEEKEVLRHETIHAYLDESGLEECSLDVGSWAKNEEMIDWFAIQGPKIMRTWTEAGAV